MLKRWLDLCRQLTFKAPPNPHVGLTPPTPSERLAATLRPDPEYRRKRNAQLTPERIQRITNSMKAAGL